MYICVYIYTCIDIEIHVFRYYRVQAPPKHDDVVQEATARRADGEERGSKRRTRAGARHFVLDL